MGVVKRKDHLRVRTKLQKDTRTLISREVGGETRILRMRIAAVRPLLSRVNIVHHLTDEILLIIW